MWDLPGSRIEPVTPALAGGRNHWTTREVHVAGFEFASVPSCLRETLEELDSDNCIQLTQNASTHLRHPPAPLLPLLGYEPPRIASEVLTWHPISGNPPSFTITHWPPGAKS